MRLTILGCSGSLAGPESPASGYLVEVPGSAPIVLDLGPGVLGALQRFVDPMDTMLLLSHLHADHCLDLPSLLVWRRYGPRRRGYAKAPLYGPSGTAFRVGVASAEDPGAVDDITDTFVLSTWDSHPEVDLPVLEPDAVAVHVTTRRVIHPPESYAIRLAAQGRVLVYSGDTAYCEALIELATGADVLLCEASWEHPGEHPEGIHMSGLEAGRTAARAGVGRLVLTHVPPWVDAAAVLAEACSAFDGPVELAAPGLRLEV